MQMRMISFEGSVPGMSLTVPDEKERATVFATGDAEGNPADFHLNGPTHKVMSLILDCMDIVMKETEDPEMKMDFARVASEMLMKHIKSLEKGDETNEDH